MTGCIGADGLAKQHFCRPSAGDWSREKPEPIMFTVGSETHILSVARPTYMAYISAWLLQIA